MSVSLACVTSAVAQTQRDYTDPATRMAWYHKHVAMTKTTEFGGIRWQFLGPKNTSGRVTDVAVATPRGKTYVTYVAAASGGVWKTDNDGLSWKPVFQEGPSTSIGDVTLAPSNQDIVWIGTGEANIFRSSMAGTGIYLSEDGGTTFTHKGLENTHTIARVCVHPTDPNTVYVAASGHEWTDNPERGVYRTRDGGETWELVLFVDASTGAIDLALDPQDPSRIYAATWERMRDRWNDPRTYPTTKGSGIWRSEDGGDSWESINEGLPLPEHRGRIGLATTPSLAGSLYAFVDNYELVELEEDEERGEEDEGGDG